MPYGELEDAVEDHAPTAGVAAVEAEGELVEVALQMGLVDRALVSAQQPPLRQGGDAMDPRQQLAGVIAAGAGGALAASVMGVPVVDQPVRWYGTTEGGIVISVRLSV
jgi:hypothetical protein